LENSHGRHFEEFAVGDTVTSGERTLRQEDILAFAELSGDHTRLHTDEAYARQGPFGRTVAHGLLGLSVASGLLIQLGFLEGTLLAFRDLTWKFSLPVFPGDTIHVLAMVAELKALPRLGGGAVTLAIEVINQDGQTVQSGSWMVLVASKTRNS
jgi:3-hydroxybutyryl-CoA dehydratase